MNHKLHHAGHTVGFFQMIRDVLVAAINEEQFPLAMVSVIILAMIFRLPAADVSKLAFGVLASLERGRLSGWILAAVIHAGWYTYARSQRRHSTEELERISRERDEWRSYALNRSCKFSEDRP